MTTTAEALSAQAVKLSPQERIEVVERILDSLDEPDAALDALWAKEADDRLAAYRRGEVKAVALSKAVGKYQVNSKPAQQNRLTPTPKALQKALEQSAKQAQRMADAFGLVVPHAKPKATSRTHTAS